MALHLKIGLSSGNSLARPGSRRGTVETMRILLQAHVDVNGIQSAILQEFGARSPDGAVGHLPEVGAEIVARIERQLAAKGMSIEELDREAMRSLTHFHSHPEFAQYFT